MGKIRKEGVLKKPRMRRDNCHSCSKIRQLHIVIHFVHWCGATWQLVNCDNCDKYGHMVTLCKRSLAHGHIVRISNCDNCAADPDWVWQVHQGSKNSGFWRDPGGQGPGKWESGSKASRENFYYFSNELIDIVIPYLTCILLANVIHRSTFTEWRDHASNDTTNRIT